MRLKRRLVTLTISGLLASTISISPAYADGVPSYPGSASLRTGVENSAVKKMQAALMELGYDIPVANGKYGPATTRAVSKFYAENGDIDDGTSVGPLGWNEIFIALDEQRAVNRSEKEYDDAPKEEVAAQLNPEQAATVIPEGQRGKQPARGPRRPAAQAPPPAREHAQPAVLRRRPRHRQLGAAARRRRLGLALERPHRPRLHDQIHIARPPHHPRRRRLKPPHRTIGRPSSRRRHP